MRKPTHVVLAALVAGPLHGYAIIQRAERMLPGRIRLPTGTLYAALDWLTAEGYVRPVSERAVAGRNRTFYEATPPGLAALRSWALQVADESRPGYAAGGGPAVERVVSIGGRVRLGAKGRRT